MDCPTCGYVMTEFETDCPRCRNLAAQQGLGEGLVTSPVHQQSELRPPAAAPNQNTGAIAIILTFVILACFGYGAYQWAIDTNRSSWRSPSSSPATTATPSNDTRTKTWVEVARLEGNGNKRSAPFSLGQGKKRLRYAISNDEMAICMIYVVEDGTSLETTGGFPEVSCDTPGTSDLTYLPKSAGSYYFDVSSANCTWVAIIEEEK